MPLADQQDLNTESMAETNQYPEKRTGELNWRAYKHTKCGETTVVSADTLDAVCNPLAPVPVTWCSTCNDMDVLAEFTWTDTDESLVAFRARMNNLISPFWRTVSSLSFYIAVASGVAAAIGGATIPEATAWKVGASVIGFFLGLGLTGTAINGVIEAMNGLRFSEYR